MTAAATVGADAGRRLATALTRASSHFERRMVDAPLIGWHGRTGGVRVQDSRGEDAWLRVVVARPELARGDWWNGNVEASAIDGVRRPAVLAWHEWAEGPVSVRAELMELLPGTVCSPTPELHRGLDLDDRWWSELDEGLARLAAHPTERRSTTAESIAHRSHVLFGARHDLSGVEWTTAHGDLHWANLFAPEFALLDWEAWGLAPAGSDIAGLYLHSLLVPDVANAILERFPDVFASTSGRIGLVFHASRILARAMGGDYPDLIDPVHEAVRRFAPQT
ncbi:hypothetical protein AB3M89_04725 [Microbacterium sp. 179-I 3D2 NHS]|uniref:hypothetical protein n=1 Tax=Microbacterium sp. 179-I 3D2 NHS TaxID=3235178 RepID=UPI0039A1E947